MSTKKGKREYRTLLSSLAYGSEIEARKLLKKHTGEDAESTTDLEDKLARFYAQSTNKREVDVEFALIHPHKDFILKHAAPKQVAPAKEEVKEDPIIEAQPLAAEVKIPIDKPVKEAMSYEGYLNASGHQPCGNPNCKHCRRFFHEFSNCNGNQQCSCNSCSSSMSGNGGCSCGNSSFNGTNSSAEKEPSKVVIQPNQDTNNTTALIALVGIVGIFGMVILQTKLSK